MTIVRVAALLFVVAGVAAPLCAQVVVTEMPRGMVQQPGQTTTDRFFLANFGSEPVAISLIARGGFFSAAPGAFTLQPRATQEVSLRANALTPGVYPGSVLVMGPFPQAMSVPVKLLVTNPPAGPVTLAAVEQRVLTDPTPPPVIISPPIAPSPVVVTFANVSSVPATALVVTDALWLSTAEDFVVIPPGRTASVRVDVDPSKRSDGADPIGSESGKVSLVFFGGAAGAATQLSTVVVYVNKAHIAAGTPPPVPIAELAFFVGRMGGGVDLSLLARGENTAIRDLRLFYERGGVSQFPQLPTNRGISFVDIAGSAGSVQIRTPDFAALNLAAVKTSIYNGRAFSAVLPVLTSAQGAAPGGKIYLTGVAKDAATATDLHLQEVSGHPATVRVDYLDRNGSAVASRTESLGAFASVFQRDGVPASAFTVLISNDASSAGRIAAIALVRDLETGDVWPVRDGGIGAAAPGETLFVPMVHDRSDARAEIHVVNRGSDVGLARLEVTRAREWRRRAASRGPASPAAEVVSIAPNGGATYQVDRAAGGAYARILTTGGAVAASARMVERAPGGGRFGSALPVVASSSVLRAGSSRSFAGVEDSAAATVRAATALTFRSELILIETAGRAATVRVTLHYTVSTGLAAAKTSSSDDVSLGAGAFLSIAPLARAIIGPPRDGYGDLRNMVLTVEVIGGAGEVIPILRTTENHSGDATIRGQ